MATELQSPEILYPHWQNEYVAALLEFDNEAVKERIITLKGALSTMRWSAFNCSKSDYTNYRADRGGGEVPPGRSWWISKR